MPVCENCASDVNEILEITLPKSMKSHNRVRDFRKRKKAKLCFSCIRRYAQTSLSLTGYWHKIIFPHQHKS